MLRLPSNLGNMMKTSDHKLARSLLTPRPRDAHKGTFGHVLILAGSRGFIGAALLASEAALRSGVGLVTLGVPRTLADVAASALMEAMTLPLPATPQESFSQEAVIPALEATAAKQAVVLGPGSSQQVETRAFVADFVRQCPQPLLIDADGLNCLRGQVDALLDGNAPRILTPHPGEMSRLSGQSIQEIQAGREKAAVEFAQRHGCIVVLKGHGTIVAAPSGESFFNTTGNAGLAKGGTGDVLAGLIGGLLAQGMTGLNAAALGVYLHGRAGDLAANAKTERGMTARDVLLALPDAWRELEENTAR